MIFVSFFEAGMLICFGLSWPTSLYKTFKSKSVAGKSVIFSFLVLLGYLCGIFHKVFYSLDFVIWLYIINALFLVTDIILYFKYRNNNILAKS